jgi:hypothetical protein
MPHYRESLSVRGVALRAARYKNPIKITDEGVWVIVETRDRQERTRFLVDAADYETLVRPYRWNVGGVNYDRVYTSARSSSSKSGNSTVLLHRWLLNPPADLEVDHINRNPLDNRRENLRTVTRKQNEENQPPTKHGGSSKYRGVWFDKKNKKYRAAVTHNYVAHKSPRFLTEEEANHWAIEKRAELFTHTTEDAR